MGKERKGRGAGQVFSLITHGDPFGYLEDVLSTSSYFCATNKQCMGEKGNVLTLTVSKVTQDVLALARHGHVSEKCQAVCCLELVCFERADV